MSPRPNTTTRLYVGHGQRHGAAAARSGYRRTSRIPGKLLPMDRPDHEPSLRRGLAVLLIPVALFAALWASLP